MELRVFRDRYTEKSTGGELLHIKDNSPIEICETLEDARRAPGLKIKSHTCIPPGRYKVAVTHSSRFQRPMPIVYNCANGYEIKAEGISYTGIRIHGGNTHENTDGCLLVAYNEINADTIQGTAEKEVTAMIQSAINKGEEVWIEFVDNF